MPQLNENDEWIYDGAVYISNATAKCEKYGKNLEFSLLKQWEDSGYEDYRPATITVSIYKDGVLYLICDHPSRASYIRMNSSEIIKKITGVFPELDLKKIVTRVKTRRTT